MLQLKITCFVSKIYHLCRFSRGKELDHVHSYLHCARHGLDKNIVSTTAPERAVLSVMSLGVALRTDQSGASEAAETFIFLASI